MQLMIVEAIDRAEGDEVSSSTSADAASICAGLGKGRLRAAPGATQLTRMPKCPSSSANALVRASKVVLLIAYMAMGATGTYAV